MVTKIGNDGNNFIRGTNKNDFLSGGNGIDTLVGLKGNDTLIGDKGDDLKFGGAGNDRLIWNNGDGSDKMRGGGGYDVTEVNGAVDAGDNFELRANGDRAEFERLNLINFTLDTNNVEQFEINGLGGNDTLRVQDLTGTDVQQVIFNGGKGNDLLDASDSSTKITANGGTGSDELIGSSANDILVGAGGNDDIEGEKGDDTMIGGLGNDTLGWDDGDGSDIMEGDGGYDVTEVDGAVAAGDNFELRANGDRAEFERLNLGNFTLDTNNVEQFEINGLGGNDTLSVQDLTGTDVQQAIFNGGKGNDLLDASDSSTKITADGGTGSDELIGSSANDILVGAGGNDDIEGEKGDDTMIGGLGNDTLGWDDGDGSDIMEGDGGYDVTEVDGAVAAGDNFELRANGDRAEFERLNLGNFTLDTNNVEQFEINGLGGNDTLRVKDLTGTDVQQVIFNGGKGNDLFDASQTSVNVSAFGDRGNDSLTGGSGNDVLEGGNGNDILMGGRGADTFVLGSNGIDTIADFNFSEGDKLQISSLEFGISSLDALNYDASQQTLSGNQTELVMLDNLASGFDIANNVELI